MSDNQIWQLGGEFVPFSPPVVPPGIDPNTGDLYQVCFSTAWLPYILTCLKPLAQYATWEGDDAEIEQAVKRGSMLLSMFGSPADCGEGGFCSNFDFRSASHSDQWSGISSGTCSAPVWDGDILLGWIQIACDPSGTDGVVMNIHGHFSSEITIDRMDIIYGVFDLGPHADQSVVALWSGTTRGGTLIAIEQPLSVGTGMFRTLEFSPIVVTDVVVEVQIQASDDGVVDGDIVINEVAFFGTGDPPEGGEQCE